MKTKILSVLLLCTLFFSIFGVFASASDGTDLLRTEIESNLPDVDLDNLPGNRIITIGAMEDLIDESCLYLYLYNPKKLNVRSGYMNLDCSFESSSGKTSKSYDIIAFSVVAKTNDGNFCKVRIDLSSIADKLKKYNTVHSYSWDKVVLKYSSLGSVKEETVLQEYEWKFDYSTGSCNVTYNVEEVAELDVHHTYYRTPSATASRNTFDEIHTVYFSIPDEYTKYYSKLYSVASTYTKKKTNGVLIGTDPLLKNTDMDSLLLFLNHNSMLSSDYKLGTNSYGETLVVDFFYTTDTAFNVSNDKYVYYEILDKNFLCDIGFYFYCDNVIENPEDLKVTEEEFFEYVCAYEEESYSHIFDLFSSSEYVPWSEKTINDSFDSIAYANRISGDFSKLVDAYGMKTAFQFWLHRKNPLKFQELCEKYLVNVNAENLTDVQNLLLCDTQVREDANALSNQEFSDKYLINIDDVPSFKEFLKNNKNVVLYRFDVVDYYSDEVVLGKTNEGAFQKYESEYRYALVQMYAYFGFRVIDVTFNDEGNFVSLAVNSHPQDFASNPGLEEDEPPVEWDPKLDDLGDDLKAKAIRLIINVVIVIVSVAVVILGISWVLDGIFSIPVKKKR